MEQVHDLDRGTPYYTAYQDPLFGNRVYQERESEISFQPKRNVRDISRAERLSSIASSSGPARFEVL